MMLNDPLGVLFLLTIVVYVALRLEAHFPFFESLGAALVAILIGMVLSNSGVIPGESPTYDFLHSTGVSLGIVFILVGVDVKTIAKAGPTMLLAFALGAVGSAAGATVAALLLATRVGPETWKLAGQFTGTYVGGGMNFAALGQQFDTSSNLFTAAIAADVILTAVWMAICLAVPVALGKQKNVISVADDEESSSQPFTLERALYSSGTAMPLAHTAGLAAVALGAVYGAKVLGERIPVLPEVLWLTTLSLIAGQLPPVKKLVGSAMLGNYLILLFLASNGAQSVVANIVRVGPSVFYYACLTVAIHGLVVFGVGRLFRIDFGTLAIASQANVGGAASAMAMASARGYADRLLPGVAVGLFGYAAGNYLGVAVALMMKSWLGA